MKPYEIEEEQSVVQFEHRTPVEATARRRRAAGAAVIAVAVLGTAAAVTPTAALAAPVARVAGTDRYETAVRLSERRFPEPPPGGVTVLVTSGTAAADALFAGPAAGDGVLLPVAPQSVPDVVAAELTRLRPASILVVGGEATVSTAVEQQLRRYTGTVSRLAGANRYETAVQLSELRFPERPPEGSTVYLTSGTSLADALYTGPVVAGQDAATVLPVAADEVPPAVARELRRLAPTSIVVVGGPAVVPAEVVSELGRYAGSVSRLAGADRYETAVLLSELRLPDRPPAGSTPYVASGTSFADALFAGPVVATEQTATLLPVRRDDVPAVVAAELRRLAPASVVVVGGAAVVSDQVERRLSAL